MRVLSTLTRVNDWFWGRIISSTQVSQASLGAFRIVFGIYLLFFGYSYSWLGSVPQAFFNPHIFSFANFFNGFPSEGVFLVFDILSLLSITCVILGLRAKWAGIIYVLVSFIGLSFYYSFGKVDHSILVYATLLCFTFSGWGSYFALVPDKPTKEKNSQTAVAVLAVILCFAMFTAGFEKGLKWIDFDLTTSGVAWWYYTGYYNLDRVYLLAPYVSKSPAIFFEMLDYCGVLLELSPLILLLVSKKAWRFWLISACSFHLINSLALNIPFTMHYLIYASFIDFGPFLSRARQNSFAHLYALKIVYGLVVVAALWNFAKIFVGEKQDRILTLDPLLGLSLDFVVGLICTSIIVYAFGRQMGFWSKDVQTPLAQ